MKQLLIILYTCSVFSAYAMEQRLQDLALTVESIVKYHSQEQEHTKKLESEILELRQKNSILSNMAETYKDKYKDVYSENDRIRGAHVTTIKQAEEDLNEQKKRNKCLEKELESNTTQLGILRNQCKSLEVELKTQKEYNTLYETSMDDLEHKNQELTRQITNHEINQIKTIFGMASLLGITLTKYNNSSDDNTDDYAIIKDEGKIFFISWVSKEYKQGWIAHATGVKFSQNIQILYSGKKKQE